MPPEPLPQKPGAHMTPKETKLSGPGGYTTTAKLYPGSAGELKPMTGSRETPVHRGAVSPFSGGPKGKSVELKGPRTIIPPDADVEW